MGKFRFPRATQTDRNANTPLDYEVLYDISLQRFYRGNGSLGGQPLNAIDLYSDGVFVGAAFSINFASGFGVIIGSDFDATISGGGGGGASLTDIWLYSGS